MAGALPGPATALALGDPQLGRDLQRASRIHIIALGKAAHEMTRAALAWLDQHRFEVAEGLVVSSEPSAAAHPRVANVVGDHPIPGPRSRAAAECLGEIASRVGPDDLVLVLLSGGTTSLIGAPEPGVTDADFTRLWSALLGSGLDIVGMNAVRKRFSRWGGGKLAAALAPARVACLAVSDVVGDDPASIGSGPTVPDERTVSDVRALLAECGLADELPASCAALLRAVETRSASETPKAHDPAFARTTTRVVAGAVSAVESAARRAMELGVQPTTEVRPVTGEAADAGRRLATLLLREGRTGLRCLLWSGETTVRLGDSAEPGGRCQELALAAAEVLCGSTRPVTLLAAGTDGRDGPTDAAGACVNEHTWQALVDAGIDPLDALRRHRSHSALDTVGALVRTGPTGTNVGDVIIGLS